MTPEELGDEIRAADDRNNANTLALDRAIRNCAVDISSATASDDPAYVSRRSSWALRALTYAADAHLDATSVVTASLLDTANRVEEL